MKSESEIVVMLEEARAKALALRKLIRVTNSNP